MRGPMLEQPEGFDYSLLAERDPNCPVCEKPGEILGETLGGQVGVRLMCCRPECPAYDCDNGGETWEVWAE